MQLLRDCTEPVLTGSWHGAQVEGAALSRLIQGKVPLFYRAALSVRNYLGNLSTNPSTPLPLPLGAVVFGPCMEG